MKSQMGHEIPLRDLLFEWKPYVRSFSFLILGVIVIITATLVTNVVRWGWAGSGLKAVILFEIVAAISLIPVIWFLYVSLHEISHFVAARLCGHQAISVFLVGDLRRDFIRLGCFLGTEFRIGVGIGGYMDEKKNIEWSKSAVRFVALAGPLLPASFGVVLAVFLFDTSQFLHGNFRQLGSLTGFMKGLFSLFSAGYFLGDPIVGIFNRNCDSRVFLRGALD
jgi:hypothetical protein